MVLIKHGDEQPIDAILVPTDVSDESTKQRLDVLKQELEKSNSNQEVNTEQK